MTLPEVAEQQKRTWGPTPCGPATMNIIGAFEADPDFTLRERLERLLKQWEDEGHAAGESAATGTAYYNMAPELRELLNPPKKERT